MSSFLESLFGTFTGEPAIQAANAARETLLNTFLGEATHGRELVFGGEGFPGFVTFNDLASQEGRQNMMGQFQQARGDLAGGSLAGIQTLNRDYLRPLWMAQSALADAQGVNGPEGVQRVRQQFQASPGYEFALTEGLDAIARNAEAAGMGASGNMLLESQKYGQGLANQEWQTYLNNILKREGTYAPITAREFELYGDLGKNLGQLDMSQGQFLNSSLIDQASRNAGLGMGQYGQELGLAGIFGPALASTNLAVGAAQQQAGANTVNAGLNILQGIGNFFRGGSIFK